MYVTTSAPTLRDALYELSMAKRIPDAELVEDVVRRFPEHAETVTAFAIELALDALRGDAAAEAAEENIDPAAVSPAVSRALSRFQNKLHAVASGKQTDDEAPAAVDNPLAGLSRAEFRNLAVRLDVNSVFLAKVRDRQIEPDSMPDGFKSYMASEMKVPLGAFLAHVSAPAGQVTRQFYKADDKPDASHRQSFEAAVRSSGLTDVQQTRLLAL